MNIQNYPILKLLLPYILGIFLVYFLDFKIQNLLLFGGIIIVILLIFSLLFIILPYGLRWVAELGPIVVAGMLGVLSTSFHFHSSIDEVQEAHLKNCRFFTVFITEPPVEKAKSVKIVAEIAQDSSGFFIGAKSIFYLHKDSAALSLQNGDELLISTIINPILPPKNPYSFDNQLFLRRKGIYYTGYVAENSWTLLASHSTNHIRDFAYHLQHHFSDLFAQNGLQGDEYSVITAVLLGNDETMEPELKARYSSAGVSHILCVSGMHVGIIFMIINFLLKPLDYSRKLSWLKALLLLLSIWFYAQITGLSPSVKRAATMFTFVTIGGLLRRPVTIFHSLFASLFLLLLLNPLLIFEIGFEMSYLAVFGIVIFQPKIVALYKPRTKIFNYFWELTAVSISAQLATFPLSVFYFGQFPNYFLLANLSVIALSFAVVVTGVALLATSWFSIVSNLIGKVLTLEIKLLNGIVSGIDSLPGSVTDNISLNWYQMILFYLIIIAAFVFGVRKSKFSKFAMLIFGMVLGLSFCYSKIQSIENYSITIYSVLKMTAIGVNQGGRSILLMDSSALNSPFCYNFNIRNHELHERISSRKLLLDSSFVAGSACKIGNFILAGKTSIYILSGKEWIYPRSVPLAVDYLYLRDNPKVPMCKLLKTFHCKRIIIDESCSNYYENRWTDSCLAYQIPCYSTSKNGFLKIAYE